MKDILGKLTELEASAPKITKKKLLNEDSATPPINVSNKPSTLKDIFETMAAGQKPIPVVGKEGSTQQTGAGFLNITDPALQGLGKALGDLAAQKKIQMVVPTQPGQQQGQQSGQPNQAGATGQPQPGQMQMKEKDEGKPGKNFAKIAKSAAKRYGSKEAGERVAGAVRAKLAKQGKLEESISAAREVPGFEPVNPNSDPVLARIASAQPNMRWLKGTGDNIGTYMGYSSHEKTRMPIHYMMVSPSDPDGSSGAIVAKDGGWTFIPDGERGTDKEERFDRRSGYTNPKRSAINTMIDWHAYRYPDDYENGRKKMRDDNRERQSREWSDPVMEGAKVDRMVKHIEKSERGLGKSKEKASDIAWATANKRGMLDNKNKKKVKEADIPSSQGVDTRGAGLGAGRSMTTLEAKKPDFLDLDKDDNKKEPMKKAAADKKKQKVKESMNHRISAARFEGKSHGLKGHAHCGKSYEDLEERKAYCEGYKDGLDECYGMGVYEAAPVMPATVGGMADAAMDEGNAFTAALARTPRGGQFKVGGKTFTDRTGYDASLDEMDYAFESLDRQLNALLIESEEISEGLSVSISKGQQNAPDSVTVTAQDGEAEHLLALVKNAGLGLFGDEPESEPSSAMSVQPVNGDAAEIDTSNGDIKVVDGHEGMMGLMQKLTGIQGGDDHEDYADEESHEDHTCNECGMMETSCHCDDEAVEETETLDQEEEVAEETDAQADEYDEAEEDAALAKSDEDEEVTESFFEMVQRLNSITESSDDEEEATEEDDEEDVTESSDDEESDESEDLNEWANNAGKKGTDASFEQDIDFMTKVIAGGLNKPKSTGQTTVPVIAGQADRMKDHQGPVSDAVDDWKKLAGIK